MTYTEQAITAITEAARAEPDFGRWLNGCIASACYKITGDHLAAHPEDAGKIAEADRATQEFIASFAPASGRRRFGFASAEARDDLR